MLCGKWVQASVWFHLSWHWLSKACMHIRYGLYKRWIIQHCTRMTQEFLVAL